MAINIIIQVRKIRNHKTSITPNPGYHLGSDKNIGKHHIHDSQKVSHFQAGDHKAVRNRQDSMTDKHET